MNPGVGQATALLADIGATNARFALLREGKLGEVLTFPVADHATSYGAVAAALERLGSAQVPQTAVLAFAGPVDEARAVMTNAGWDTTEGELRRRFGFSQVRLLNDYAALALSLARLGDGDRLAIGGLEAAPDSGPPAPLAVLGPGSGLGVAALLPAEPAPRPLISEGGHVTMAATDRLEADLFALLREDFGHVSAERVLSGPGLSNIHSALTRLQGDVAEVLDPATVTHRGLEGGDPLCRQALDLFCLLLGTFAGNLALSYGARGGVYLAGGILPRFPDFLAASGFRARFEDKGRFRGYLQDIPTWLITRPNAAFLGLAATAEQPF
ncbi:glucokinase [Pelagibius marinus]|uniref:glucokinase n=1 Tax=Pelagibius marinus TaxID=2762760 RepID=UPI001872A073|nr:glucokinase [Pelagibius marinus]